MFSGARRELIRRSALFVDAMGLKADRWIGTMHWDVTRSALFLPTDEAGEYNRHEIQNAHQIILKHKILRTGQSMGPL